MNSFSNALIFKNIDAEDIMAVQNYVRTDLHEKVNNEENFDEAHKICLFGSFAKNPPNFSFNRGELKLLTALIKYVKEVVDSPAENMNLKKFNPKNSRKIMSNINHCLCSTPIGTIFGRQNLLAARIQNVNDNMSRNVVKAEKSLDELKKELVQKVQNMFAAIDDIQTHEDFSESLIQVMSDGTKIVATVRCIYCDESSGKKTVKVFREMTSRSSHWVISNLSTHLTRHHGLKKQKKNTELSCFQGDEQSTEHNDLLMKESTLTLEIVPAGFSTDVKTTTKNDNTNSDEIQSDDVYKMPSDDADLTDQLYTQMWTQNLRMENILVQNNEKTFLFSSNLLNNETIEACKIQPDGNCLFSALSHQLFYHKIESKEHQAATNKLREDVVLAIKNNPGSFEKELKGRVLEHTQDKKAAMENIHNEVSFFLNVLLPKKKVCWGGIETIKAVSQIYKVNIIVINSDGSCNQPMLYESSYERTLLLAYCSVGDKVQNNHYDSVAKINSSLIDKFATQLIENDFKRQNFIKNSINSKAIVLVSPK